MVLLHCLKFIGKFTEAFGGEDRYEEDEATNLRGFDFVYEMIRSEQAEGFVGSGG